MIRRMRNERREYAEMEAFFMKKTSGLSTKLCKKALTASLGNLAEVYGECILIFFEPKQPENMNNVDLKQLRDNIK